jgi:cytochrome c
MQVGSRGIGRLLAASFVAIGLLLARPPHAAAGVAGHGGPIRALVVAPDGKTALTGGFDYSVILWDLAGMTPLRRLEGHAGPVDAIAFLPHERAVSAGDDSHLIVWNLANGSEIARWQAHTAKVAALAASPDGKTLASAGWDRRVVLWDVASGRPRVVSGHEANVNAVAFSPDGRLLASGDYGGAIMLWRLPAGEPIATLPGNGFPVNALAFAPGGRLIAALGDGSVRVIDPATKREMLRYGGHSDPVVSLAVSHDGALVASGSSRGAVDIWSLAGGATRRGLDATLGPAWALAFLPDDQRLLAAGADGRLRQWSVAAGSELSGIAPAIAPPPPTARGAMLFRKCSACHAFDPADQAKAGPTFWHLIGRRAGSVAGYPYSSALRNSRLVWDAATIDRLFALGPEIVAPGSKMPLQRMPSARDRADLIEYLKENAGTGNRVE